MKKIIKFLIKISGLPMSELVQWEDIRNGDKRFELRLREYDVATMDQSKLLRIKHLLEELGFTLMEESK